jgi:hypothetical protein
MLISSRSTFKAIPPRISAIVSEIVRVNGMVAVTRSYRSLSCVVP